MRKIRKGDEVVLLAGKDKGRRGTVTQVFPNDRVLVENVNILKHYERPNPQEGKQGGIVSKEAPVHVSNVAIFNPATGKADRVGIRQLEDGNKVRFFKSNDEVIDI